MNNEVLELIDIVKRLIVILPDDTIGYMMREKLLVRLRKLEGKLYDIQDQRQNAGGD